VEITIREVVKRFGAVTAVDRADLTVRDGELFTLLGPSGCGKTTLLRLLAGFYQPDAGEIRFGDRVVSGLPPYERNIGMVFQNYALWPHMTAAANVAYGLKLRKLGSAEVAERLREGLRKVNLTGFESRYPGQLSGGQQQRVALARALVLNPDILLLDEPLSNLDAKIRVQVRAEIRKLQQELGITTAEGTLRAAAHALRRGLRRHQQPRARAGQRARRRPTGRGHRARPAPRRPQRPRRRPVRAGHPPREHRRRRGCGERRQRGARPRELRRLPRQRPPV
jgi:ABC-type nitrate/sulfonate/bicarbonate transport system ATPase subunit